MKPRYRIYYFGWDSRYYHVLPVPRTGKGRACVFDRYSHQLAYTYVW